VLLWAHEQGLKERLADLEHFVVDVNGRMRAVIS
jgi:hypothetical protein